MDAADVSLGLRYLTGFEVLVAAGGRCGGRVGRGRSRALGRGTPGARPGSGGRRHPRTCRADAVAFEAPTPTLMARSPTLVGRFAAALDYGVRTGRGLSGLCRGGRLGSRPPPTDRPPLRTADDPGAAVDARRDQRLDQLRAVAPDVVDGAATA